MHMHRTLGVWVENKRLLLHYAVALNRMHTYVDDVQSAEYLKK